ncbi:MAG: helix-turn-helix domain-containing protein [Candidatus Saccharimonadales bacterium]
METVLEAAGINGTLAKAYLSLLVVGDITPAAFAKEIAESRSNTYKLLDELVERGLATRADIGKKLHYRAENPSHLLTLARERKDQIELQEKQLRSTVPELVKQYYKTHEQPGVRFYQGKDGIKEIYLEQIAEAKPIQFMKTRADIEFFGFQFMHEVRNLAPKANIQRKAFTPDAPETPVDIKESDKAMLLERTWYLPEDYTAPVEWSVFGNKVSIISFGKEAIGMVIESAQVAESLRQMFGLLDEGLKRRPGYSKLPTRGEFTDVESFVTKHNNTLPRDM